MKKFILGFLTAALLFSAFPVGAAVQQYILTASAAKIVVDGEEVKDAKLPILAYNGYNYIPASVFKTISEKIGVGFKWDGTVKEIQISTAGTSVTTSTAVSTTKGVSTTSGIIDLEIVSAINPTQELTKDNIKIYQYQNVKYINVNDAYALVKATGKYVLNRDLVNLKASLVAKDKAISPQRMTIIPLTKHNHPFITYDSWETYIKPIL
jgi:hypothetical protein